MVVHELIEKKEKTLVSRCGLITLANIKGEISKKKKKWFAVALINCFFAPLAKISLESQKNYDTPHRIPFSCLFLLQRLQLLFLFPINPVLKLTFLQPFSSSCPLKFV